MNTFFSCKYLKKTVTKTETEKYFSKRIQTKISDNAFAIKKVKSAILRIYVLEDFNGEKIFGTIYVKELQKTNKTEFKFCK